MMMSLAIVLTVMTALAANPFVETAEAEPMYVTDVLRLTLRSSPGTGGDIVGVIQSGQNLEVVTETENWAQVRLPDGREGWVPSRYLISEKTAEIKMARLQQQFESQKKQLEEIRSEAAELKKRNEALEAELAQRIREAAAATEAYNSLKAESADFLNLKTEHESTLEKAAEQSGKIIGLEKQLTRLETQRLVRWFLAGAGVLLLGFIIGFGAKRQRRRYIA